MLRHTSLKIRAVIQSITVSLIFGLAFFMPKANARIDDPNKINQKLKTLYEQGNFSQAYEFAHEYLIEMEGNAAFDFYYGLSALGLNEYTEARFAFERLVTLYPQQERFKLEFGRILYGLNQFDLANEQFNQVLDSDPPPQVRENINAFLGVIGEKQRRSKKRWSGAIGLSSGIDGNINNATELETFNSITLSEASRSIQSDYVGALTSLNYGKALNQRHHFGTRFSSQHKQNGEVDDYDFDTAYIQNYWARKHAKGEFQLGVSYLNIWVSGQDYEKDIGLTTTWRQTWGNNYQTQLALNYTRKDFDVFVEQNNDQPSLSFIALKPTGRSLHTLSLSYSSDQARDEGLDNRMKDVARMKYRYTRFAKKQFEFFTEAGLTLTDYQDDHPLFGEMRADETAQVTLGTKWKFDKQWSAQFEASFTDNESNLTLFEYERHLTKLQLLWNF